MDWSASIRGLLFAVASLAFGLSFAAPTASASATVTTTTLPGNLGLRAFAANATGIYATGTIQEGAGIAGNCDLAPVTTHPLGIGQPTIRSCTDPALWAEPVAPVETMHDPGTYDTLRIARRVKGSIRLGPALATYQLDSGSAPVDAYGDGLLWIYEQQAADGPTIFEVSKATGDLLASVRAPRLTRPLLVADDDGAWLVPAGSFGAVNDVALYHVAPRSGGVVPALTLPGYRFGFAAWVAATGHRVAADFCVRPVTPTSCAMYGFTGPNARPTFHRGRPPGSAGFAYAVGGPHAVYVIARATSQTRWAVVRVDASTGVASTIASVHLGRFWTGPNGTRQPNAVVVGRSLFLLTNANTDESGVLKVVRW